ncbi:MAG: ABC transporter permease [Sedimentisphaerales bacterium]|nr:ABC transporter permease [Sedimentisphaerales bacterium]
MSRVRLLYRSLGYFWRTHLGTLLGAALGTAVLTGALLVGDSVRFSLAKAARQRLGSIQWALTTHDQFFRARLADELASDLFVDVAPVLQAAAVAVYSPTDARCHDVRVLGVDSRFWRLGAAPNPLDRDEPAVVINRALADRLGVAVGDEILLRIEKPSALPREAIGSLERDASRGVRLPVQAIVDADGFGRFYLQADQVSPFNAFVPLEWLAQTLAVPRRANMLLAADAPEGSAELSQFQSALGRHWTLADMGLHLQAEPSRGTVELRTSQIFLEPAVIEAARAICPEGLGIFGYFVNELRVGERQTPYSIVAAVGELSDADEQTVPDERTGSAKPADQTGSTLYPVERALPDDLRDDEVVISRWLADDLQARPDDWLEMRYYLMAPGRRLIEPPPRCFRIRAILPMDSAAIDPNLMPEFPGLSEAANCRDWQAGVPLDFDRIRDRDEQYWDQYRGAPKAFVTLAAGQEMWSNRFGRLTAIRFAMEKIAPSVLQDRLPQTLRPESLGMVFRPVGQQALLASREGVDFGPLFLGLSFFLIAAALILTGLLFAFGIEQRQQETGLLRALGFTPMQVRGLFLAEGLVLAILAAVLGLVASLLYTAITIGALGSVWSQAVAQTPIEFHAGGRSLAIGGAAGVLIAVLTMGLGLWRQGRQPVRLLLQGLLASEQPGGGLRSRVRRVAFGLAAAAAAATVGILLWAGFRQGESTTGMFFAAATLLLAGGAVLLYGMLAGQAEPGDSRTGYSLADVAWSNACRRRGRSLAVALLLACGCFLVFVVGANRHDPLADAGQRWSGTGGFALVAECSLPFVRDVRTAEGRELLGLEEPAFTEVSLVPLRVLPGDDASCLNLNRPQQPQVLGVRPEDLAKRRAFRFVQLTDDRTRDNPWQILDEPLGQDEIPAVTDQNTIIWALGKKLGDTLDYTDEQGHTVRLRLAGALAGSILQGSLIISEAAFIQRFPSVSGYRWFLIDAPAAQQAAVADQLTRAGRDLGWRCEPAARRLGRFLAVENTYLEIFEILGGLGMLLGSVGLALVVLRNVMERRSELGLLRAIGYERSVLRWMLLLEHGWLLGLGLALGVVSALVAVWPTLQRAGRVVPYESLGLMLLGLLLAGLMWIYLAARLALRGRLQDAIRQE